MRRLQLASFAGLLVASTALLGAGQTPPPRPVVEPSNLFLHSPLVNCSAEEGDATATRPNRLRVATWNIQAARSASVSAIADELRSMQADVVALQEVDVRVRRTGFVDEPAALADALGFDYVFAASIKWDEGDYGLAVLSRWPIADARRYRFDATDASEPRIALDVRVCVGGEPLRLVNHHADNRAQSRAANFAALKDIVAPDVGRGLLLLGDFNERRGGPDVVSLLSEGLVDLATVGDVEPGTPVPGPPGIDYLLADGPLAARMSTAQVWRTDKSDHNAVFADLTW